MIHTRLNQVLVTTAARSDQSLRVMGGRPLLAPFHDLRLGIRCHFLELGQCAFGGRIGRAQPDDRLVGAGVDFVHNRYLRSSLGEVGLVDADAIDPDVLPGASAGEVSERIE
jgi:hypothetical protein